MCKILEHFREVFTTYTTDEKQRHIVDRTLNEVKKDLNSMTELIDRLIKENQVLSQQMQSAQSKSNHLREELDAGRERNVQHPKVTCADDTAFETQFKMESLSVDQSKDRRITELEEEVAKVKRTVQQLSELVGTQKSRPVSAQQAPRSPENRKNGKKPILELTAMDTSQFLTRQPKEIPAEDFVIIADDVELTEIGNNLILLKKILNQDYGRVVGRRRQNVERLEQEYGVKIHFFDVRPEKLKIIISEGDADSRRVASNDITEKLKVVVECPNLKIDSTALQMPLLIAMSPSNLQPPPPPPQQLQQQQQQQQETQNPMTSSVFSKDLGGSGRPLTGSSSPRDPSLPWFSGIVSHEDPTRGGSDPLPIPPPVLSTGHSSPTDPDGSNAQSRGSLPPYQQLGPGPSQSVEKQHDDERVYSQNRISNMSQSQKPATIVPPQSQPPGTFGVDAPLLLCGDQSPSWTREDILNYSETKLGYTRDSPGFQRFINVLSGMNAEDRKTFLQLCVVMPTRAFHQLPREEQSAKEKQRLSEYCR
ncbi:arp2/3 complex-activating protein rickA-like [Daphnia pulicaria]|uniref:arp2/3 complex-activating protein rickA-like n=1 Tax=Daphnia pulicaria TaxID=35523 RepID=UPI001EEC11F5|nr:arp2/3 complex-activating protein rickA-like [Daphnia pulicaria]